MTIVTIDSMKQKQQHYFNGNHEDSGNKKTSQQQLDSG